MKFEFIDFNNRHYEFELDAEPDITGPHVEVTVYGPSALSSTTIRPIVNGKVKWFDLDDAGMVSSEARIYLDKVIKNKIFL